MTGIGTGAVSAVCGFRSGRARRDEIRRCGRRSLGVVGVGVGRGRRGNRVVTRWRRRWRRSIRALGVVVRRCVERGAWWCAQVVSVDVSRRVVQSSGAWRWLPGAPLAVGLFPRRAVRDRHRSQLRRAAWAATIARRGRVSLAGRWRGDGGQPDPWPAAETDAESRWLCRGTDVGR